VTRKTDLGNPLSEAADRRRLVLVYWRDSCYIDGYDTEEGAIPYLLIWTVGFVLRQDADGIVMGSEQVDNREDAKVKYVHAIPAAQILSVVDLVEAVGA
jgi:hypothetical protein